MITAIHTLIYSDRPEETRAFLRDVLQLPANGDAEWPIFRTGPSEMGVHPTSGEFEGQEFTTPRHHEISLMCDDIEATRADLESRGAQFVGPTEDKGWGLGAVVLVPGTSGMLLYQPRHDTAYDV
ncbi:VOC family protein [Actinomycetota bacterium]